MVMLGNCTTCASILSQMNCSLCRPEYCDQSAVASGLNVHGIVADIKYFMPENKRVCRAGGRGWGTQLILTNE